MYCTRQLLLINQDKEEVLTENSERWVMFPIKYHSFWKLYKNAQNAFWAAENFIFPNDLEYFKSVDPLVLQSLINVLQYHVENEKDSTSNSCIYTCELIKQVQIPEARAFYGFQIMFENVHSEALGSLHRTLSPKISLSIHKYKLDWNKSNLERGLTFFEKIFCNLLEKTIFNTGLLIIKDYLSRKNVSNETIGALRKIENDIEIQAQFATTLIRMLKYRLEESVVYEYLNDAINVEFDFLKNAINFEKLELDEDRVLNYLHSTGDNLLSCIEYQPQYSVKNESGMEILNTTPLLNVEVKKKVDHGRQEVILDEEF